MKKMIELVRPVLRPPYRGLKYICHYIRIHRETMRLLKIPTGTDQKIYYFGIPLHSNMGDMAQYYCIRAWLKTSYPDATVYEFDAITVCDPRFGFLDKLGHILSPNDIIVFQSGYTTQDLGGKHELMHRLVIDRFPEAIILMMPQTIYFQYEENRRRTAESYSRAKNMLFMSRDRLSYEQALDMFTNVKNVLYPDIVTSLIGKYSYNHQRGKILMCCRNDGEKFYSSEEIKALIKKLRHIDDVVLGDTTLNTHYAKIRKNLEQFVLAEIEKFSRFRLTITDRYHGTIFSLAANTPVIVIKTTDHKVVTGVDWFKGIYDDAVFLADSLEHANRLADEILNRDLNLHLSSYFKEEYYDKLKNLINEI